MNHHCQSTYFSIKNEYQNSGAFDFFFFKTLFASKCYSSKGGVVLLPWLSFWRLRLLKRTLCHVQSQKRLSPEVTGWWPDFKMAKIDLVWPFYLALVSNFAMGKPTRSTKNEPLVFKYLLNLCVSKLEVFTQLPPAYHENSGNSMVSCRDFL